MKAFRTDQDPAVHDAYEDFAVQYEGGEGAAAHGAIHNAEVGRFLTYWLGQERDVSARQCWSDLGLTSDALSGRSPRSARAKQDFASRPAARARRRRGAHQEGREGLFKAK